MTNTVTKKIPPVEEKRKKKRSPISIVSLVAVYAVVILLALIVIVPFYLIIVSSFKSNYEITSSVFSWWPSDFTFEGYSAVLATDGDAMYYLESNVLLAFFNTLWQSLLPTLIGVFVAGMSGYAIAKLKFPCRGLIFTTLLATMMIPTTITLVSSYMLFDSLHWTATPLPLIIPGLFGSASNVFFMRQYFEGVPDELLDAAKIDGLGNFRTFLYIATPVSVPVFVSLSLLSFIGHYNAYLAPLIYLQGAPEYYTLQVLLKSLMSFGKGNWNMILSACVISILPLLLLYLLTQKFFIKGISISSGLKG